MRFNRKKPGTDLRKYYTVFLETGLIVVLLIFLAAMKVEFRGQQKEIDLTEEQDVVEMEEIIQTEHQEIPPPPPRPPVPVEVPNDEVIQDQILDIDAELNLDQKLEMPASPPEQEEEEDFFVVVENMPQLKGGLKGLQQKIRYPEIARKAGIEGRVTIQFIVNKEGKVENPRVVRGIGGGCDEEALRVVKQAEFEPGRQRGQPVRVQYSLPIVFKLQN